MRELDIYMRVCFFVRFSPLMMLCVLTNAQEYQTIIRTCLFYISFLFTVCYHSTYLLTAKGLVNQVTQLPREVGTHILTRMDKMVCRPSQVSVSHSDIH